MKIIALLASTRGKKTATESMYNYLVDKFNKDNITIKMYRAHHIYKDANKRELLLNELKDSDFLLICSPVYVHSLPYPLIVLMEYLAGETKPSFWLDKKMMAIIHSGYPKDIQRKASLAICKNFAVELGIKWQGGIGFGGTPIIDGRPLEESGGFTKWMRKALDEMGHSIIAGEELSSKSYDFAQKHFPSIPLWILKIMMNLRSKSQAKKNGVDLYAIPYL